jgi:hypothetical protein
LSEDPKEQKKNLEDAKTISQKILDVIKLTLGFSNNIHYFISFIQKIRFI